MLRFDQSGAIHPQHGVTQEQLKSLAPHLIDLRRDMLDDDAKRDDWRFYSLPQEQLDAYTQHREASELGRIFKVANSRMGEIDAVVFLGSGACQLLPRSLLEASCDPCHNELRRGPRGSKPRFYFAGNHFDNDDTQALLSRLAAGGYGETEEEEKWAIVVIDKTGENDETSVAFQHFLALLTSKLQAGDAALMSRLVVPITGSNSKLRDLAQGLGCEEIFTIPDQLDVRYAALSPVGLVPAAMIGLDIMKLLEGAVAMNEHFATASPSQNQVLQFVAINHLLAMHHGMDHELTIWHRALSAIGRWYASMTGLQVTEAPIFPGCRPDVHDAHSRGAAHTTRGAAHSLIVERCRTDPLPANSLLLDPLQLDSQEKERVELQEAKAPYLTDLLDATIRKHQQSLHLNHRPTTNIVLPTIDTFVLGQLFQMLMIATVMSERLTEYESPLKN